MAAIILDPSLERQRKRKRALTGADRFDEVWDGVYVMAPLANNEHQLVTLYLAQAIAAAIHVPDDGLVFPG
jgi:hypothetical protein